MIQNFHLGSSFSGSRFFHRLRDKQKEGADLRYDILHNKNYVFKSRMNKLVFSWPFTRLRREVVNISQFPTIPNSVLQLGMLMSLMVSAISVIS